MSNPVAASVFHVLNPHDRERTAFDEHLPSDHWHKPLGGADGCHGIDLVETSKVRPPSGGRTFLKRSTPLMTTARSRAGKPLPIGNHLRTQKEHARVQRPTPITTHPSLLFRLSNRDPK